MAISVTQLDNTFGNFMKANVDLENDTIKVMLLTASASFDYDNDEYIDDVSADEISVGGYTAGGATLTGGSVQTDTTNDQGEWSFDDPAWTVTGAASPAFGVFYKDTGTPSTSPIIFIVNFDGAQSLVANDTFTIQWSAETMRLK